jgi:hypothetical protein
MKTEEMDEKQIVPEKIKICDNVWPSVPNWDIRTLFVSNDAPQFS